MKISFQEVGNMQVPKVLDVERWVKKLSKLLDTVEIIYVMIMSSTYTSKSVNPIKYSRKNMERPQLLCWNLIFEEFCETSQPC